MTCCSFLELFAIINQVVSILQYVDVLTVYCSIFAPLAYVIRYVICVV